MWSDVLLMKCKAQQMYIAAGKQTNLDFTVCFPQLLPYVPPYVDSGPKTVDMPNDMWVFGGLSHVQALDLHKS